MFLHEVAAGTADRSYGIHVARLAGLPERGARAGPRPCCKRLEEGEARSAPSRAGRRPAAVRGHAASSPQPQPAPVQTLGRERLLAEINPDELTAKDALDLVYRLKKCLVDGSPAAHIAE